MPAEPDPEVRFAVVSELTALRWDTVPVLVTSHSNDTWLIDDPARGACVLRICWRGDRGRLITEAKIGRALPGSVGYPDVLGYGWTRDEHDLSWTVTRRLRGTTLAQVWPELSDDDRTAAARAVAARLRALHRWRPSAHLSDRLLSWPRRSSIDGVVGATINPLPLPRVRRLAAWARDQPWVDSALVEAAVDWLAGHSELAPELDRPGLPVIHGDLHLNNLWWDGHEVSGLLDLEWVRLAPPYLDLSRIADNAAAEATLGGSDHQALFDLLVAAYPELAVPDLIQRLRYSQLAHHVRDLFTWGPPPEAGLPPDHPLRLIAELLAQG